MTKVYMMRVFLLLAALALTATAAHAAVFSPTTFTLPNGLQVVVVEDHVAPVVTQMVWYKVGAGDEVRGKSGIAHFLEHLMFKGTAKIKPGEFSKIVSRNGGNDNAFTSWDYTAYFQSIAKDRLPLVMSMEADRMANLRLSDAVVLPERQVILAERRQTLESVPGARLNEALDAAFYRHSAYHTPIIGWRDEMEKLSTEDALAWYHRWYAPNNAVLVVSGDVTPAEVKKLALQYFGPLKRRVVPPRDRPQEPPNDTEKRVTLRDAQVRQPALVRLYAAPNYRTAKDRQAYALEVGAQILGGDTASRLYNHLVVEQRVASVAAAGYSPDSVDPMGFMFYLSPAEKIEGGVLEKALDDELQKIRDSGVTEEEVTAAKQRLVQAAILERDSVSGPAQALGSALAVGLSIDDVENWPDRIQAVTKEDVDAALKQLLATPPSTGELLPLQGDAGSDAPAMMSAPAMGGAIR
jgi:zinc protease